MAHRVDKLRHSNSPAEFCTQVRCLWMENQSILYLRGCLWSSCIGYSSQATQLLSNPPFNFKQLLWSSEWDANSLLKSIFLRWLEYAVLNASLATIFLKEEYPQEKKNIVIIDDGAYFLDLPATQTNVQRAKITYCFVSFLFSLTPSLTVRWLRFTCSVSWEMSKARNKGSPVL